MFRGFGGLMGTRGESSPHCIDRTRVGKGFFVLIIILIYIYTMYYMLKIKTLINIYIYYVLKILMPFKENKKKWFFFLKKNWSVSIPRGDSLPRPRPHLSGDEGVDGGWFREKGWGQKRHSPPSLYLIYILIYISTIGWISPLS